VVVVFYAARTCNDDNDDKTPGPSHHVPKGGHDREVPQCAARPKRVFIIFIFRFTLHCLMHEILGIFVF
jgi:hypothetical protein